MNDDFKYIAAIAEHRSISKAAHAMHISQPALSQRLKRLETKLGTELFERTTASLRPTATGEIVVRYARRAVAAENSMRRIAGEADMTFLLEYTDATNAINLRDFAQMLATEVVNTPEEADVVFSDEMLKLRKDQEQIRSTDTARIVELLNA